MLGIKQKAEEIVYGVGADTALAAATGLKQVAATLQRQQQDQPPQRSNKHRRKRKRKRRRKTRG